MAALFSYGEVRVVAASTRRAVAVLGTEPGCGGLAAWAEQSGHRRAGKSARGGLRFVFYGRVSTEDWQDPVMSRARQREQAEALVRGHGKHR